MEQTKKEQIEEMWVNEGHKVQSGVNDASSAAALIDNMPEFVRFRTRSEINHLFRKYNFKNKTLLDIGCGPGRLSFLFAAKCKFVHGIDFSPGFIDYAKEKKIELGIENVSFHVCSIEDFPLNQKFDTVFIGGVLLYMPDEDVEKLIISIKNDLLIPGGEIIIREPVSYLGHRETTALDIKRIPSEYIRIFQKVGFELIYENETFMHAPPFRFYENMSTEKRGRKWNKALFRILFTLNGLIDPFFVHLGSKYKEKATKNWTIKQKFFFFRSTEK